MEERSKYLNDDMFKIEPIDIGGSLSIEEELTPGLRVVEDLVITTVRKMKLEAENQSLRARINELEAQVGILITLLKNIEDFVIYCPVCGDDFYNHTSDWCDFKKAISTPTPAWWEAMRRVLEAAEEVVKYRNGLTDDGSVFDHLEDALAALEGNEGE